MAQTTSLSKFCASSVKQTEAQATYCYHLSPSPPLTLTLTLPLPLPRLTPSIGATETLPGRSCKQIRDVLAIDCTKVTQSGAYWVKVTSGGGPQGCCQEGEEFEVMKVLHTCTQSPFDKPCNSRDCYEWSMRARYM